VLYFLFFLFLFGLGVEEDVSQSQSNGGVRDGAVGGQCNGADEGSRHDEGMEISDGFQLCQQQLQLQSDEDISALLSSANHGQPRAL